MAERGRRRGRSYGYVVERFPSQTTPGVTYEVRYNQGRYSCNCKGWAIKRAGRERECRHTRYAKAMEGGGSLNI